MMNAQLAQARAVLIDSGISANIMLWKAPRPGEGSLPAIVLSLISVNPVRILGGEVSSETRLSATIITIKYSECVELAESVKLMLNDYRGIPVENLGTVRFWLEGTSHEIRGQGGEEDENDNESFVIVQDFRAKNTP